MQIKFFKYLNFKWFVLIFLPCFFIGSCFGAEEGKIKVKVQYSENPNQADFFANNEFEQYSDIGLEEKLEGIWTGSYTLNKQDVFWVNPSLDNTQIYNDVDFGPYEIGIKFNLINKTILRGLDILQEDVKYSSVNIDLANDKQINYWTNARNKDWFQVIRGKIFRVNENQLFTVFQTTVYEGKTAIYAFKGKAILMKPVDG